MESVVKHTKREMRAAATVNELDEHKLFKDAEEATQHVEIAIQQIEELAKKSRTNIEERLSSIPPSKEYPETADSFSARTGIGPTMVNVNVYYSGITTSWFGWVKNRNITLTADICYNVTEKKTLTAEFARDRRDKDAKYIAGYVRSIVDTVHEIETALIEEHPYYKDRRDIESQIVLGLSRLVGNPSVSMIYVQYSQIENFSNYYEQEFEEMKASLLVELDKARSEVADFRDTLSTKLAGDSFLHDLIEQRCSDINDAYVDALKTIEEAIPNELMLRQKEMREEVEKLERKYKNLEGKKGKISKDVRELSKYMRSLFPDYKHRKDKAKCVTPKVRSEAAKKIAGVTCVNPSIRVDHAKKILCAVAHNHKYSASSKHNGEDLDNIVQTVVWILENVRAGDLDWVKNKINGRGWGPRYSGDDIVSMIRAALTD